MTLFSKNSRFTKQSTLKSGHKGPKLKIYYKNHILRAFFIFIEKIFVGQFYDFVYLVKAYLRIQIFRRNLVLLRPLFLCNTPPI